MRAGHAPAGNVVYGTRRELAMSRARLKIGAGRFSTFLMIPVLTMQTAAFADCPFDWRPAEPVPGIDSAVSCLTVWDADGVGPQQPMLMAGGWTKVAEDV